MKHHAIFLFLLLILGCTQQATTVIPSTKATSKGLNIDNFTTNFKELRVNEATNIKLVLNNLGDFTARNITSLIYGYGLLERVSENNFTENILSGKQDLQYWLLEVPLKLSKTEETTYTLGVRTYYFYNFSGFSQAGFVPSLYSGEDLPLSTGTNKGPLSVSLSLRNPIRTIPGENTIFTLTILVQNNDVGTVDYYNCSPISILKPCNKGGYLSELRLIIPSKWNQVTSLRLWNNQTQNNETTYTLNYDELEQKHKYYNCTSSDKNQELCSMINEAIGNLRMIRGEEVRIVLQFSVPEVQEVQVETVQVKGDYGYKIDANDFQNPLSIQVKGD